MPKSATAALSLIQIIQFIPLHTLIAGNNHLGNPLTTLDGKRLNP